MKTRPYTANCYCEQSEATYLATKMDCRARLRSLAMTNKEERGNAMVYVLIALALFGFLTMTLSRSNDQADGQDISDEQAEFYANELMEYAASAQAAVDMMLISGTSVDELDFVTPNDAAFNTGSPVHKVFHPQGGGLNYVYDLPEALRATPNASWSTMAIQNTEWTPTTALDKLLTAIYIPRKICEILNKKITGSSDIPVMTANGITHYFLEGGASDDDFTSTICPECEGKNNLCVANSTNTNFAFYNIIAAQ